MDPLPSGSRHLVLASASPRRRGYLHQLGYDFEAVTLEDVDLARMAELVRQYDDLPLGTTDASVIAIAERLGISEIATLDRRHFTAVRPRHVEALTLLPE